MTDQTAVRESAPGRNLLLRILDMMSMPALAILTAFVLGALLILFTSGSFTTLGEAYWGLVRGAFFKVRGFSESIVATIPYILLSLGLAVGSRPVYSTSAWKANIRSAPSAQPGLVRR